MWYVMLFNMFSTLDTVPECYRRRKIQTDRQMGKWTESDSI